jgi:RNA polymerase sigma factor (sigma-70 family)
VLATVVVATLARPASFIERLVRIVAGGGVAPAAAADRQSLVRRAASGDEDAFERLVRPMGDRLLGTARKILRDGDAADDAVQQAVIRAWQMLPRLRDPQSFDGWLYKILVGMCYAEARATSRRSARIKTMTAELAAVDDIDRWNDRQLLEQAFRSLTTAHRAVVVLHHYVGLPLTEVASIVGVSPATARSRLHYAMRALLAAVEAGDRAVVVEIDR